MLDSFDVQGISVVLDRVLGMQRLCVRACVYGMSHLHCRTVAISHLISEQHAHYL